MATVISQEPAQTVAELVERLDGVPTDRIRLVPTPGTATEADVLHLADHGDRLCELVDGTLLEKAVGLEESRIASELIYLLVGFLKRSGVGGAVAGEGGMHRLLPGIVRIPDVSYVSAEVLEQHERTPIGDYAPDLAIEILSASNTRGEMDRKLREYFESGVRLVWYVDPSTRTIRVFTSPEDVTELDEGGMLDGGDVLPGFEANVGELFESGQK